MIYHLSRIFLFFFGFLLMTGNLEGQDWKFIKEKDGIKIYTKKEPGNNLKSFKGVADIRTSMDKVRNLIGNVKNVEWWDKNVKEIKVLNYEKDKISQYYLVYDAPWPVADRDLCAEALISDDPVTGVRTVFAKPLLNVIPDRQGCVRIVKYWQKWTLEPTNHGVVHAILEGYVDPGGSVPDWIYNMVITDTPLKVMRGIKQRLEK
jgi:hypothetical protein